MQKRISCMSVAFAVVVLLAASSVFAQDAACTDCHNDTTVITGKQFAWEESLHGSGTAAAYAGGRGSCTACHSGASFSGMVAAGQTPAEFTTVVDVTRQDCRACHQVHTSYTDADWALETTDPVVLYAFEEVTYDGGKGNLCANCHQPRRTIADPDPNDNIAVTSTHWGPHHGPQSAVLLGVGGAGEVEGRPSAHAMLVKDTCVSCHVGEGMGHTFEPDVSACVKCHSDAEDFDINGLQTEVAALIEELRELLVAKGLLAAETEYEIGEDGVIEEVVVGYHPVVGEYPAAESSALWNYIMIEIEDGSLGVHNPSYTVDLLNASIAALKE
ncbi:MAG: cytochrome c3 family protein [Planctomycetota bacterium]